MREIKIFGFIFTATFGCFCLGMLLASRDAARMAPRPVPADPAASESWDVLAEARRITQQAAGNGA